MALIGKLMLFIGLNCHTLLGSLSLCQRRLIFIFTDLAFCLVRGVVRAGSFVAFPTFSRGGRGLNNFIYNLLVVLLTSVDKFVIN